ncbi:hypothetical protein [Synechococcus sp. PCC 7336]|nr:hypothetical protein [Synechococcus sp. PCC 7336]
MANLAPSVMGPLRRSPLLPNLDKFCKVWLIGDRSFLPFTQAGEAIATLL